jgi:hypothetical protein
MTSEYLRLHFGFLSACLSRSFSPSGACKMKRSRLLIVALSAPVLAVFAAVADAQNCTNGNNIYHRKVGGVEVSCSQDSCHKNDPKDNANHIISGGPIGGGQQPQNIETALDTVSDMSGVRAGVGLTSSDIADVALYIWYRAGGSPCPAAGPNVGATPGSLAFGSVNTGSSSGSQAITVTNSGGGAATGMTYGAAPAGFSRTHNCPASLAAGASCTINVTFSPTAAQAYGGNITITGSGGTNIAVSLSGTGAAAGAPNVAASTGSLAFGSVSVGQTSPGQTITVTNTGAVAASNMSYPAAPAKFNKSGTCAGATLGAGASCTIVLSYSPTAAGADNATYTFTGGGKSFPIALSGTGVTGTPPPTGQLSMVTSVTMPATTVGAASAPQSVSVSNIGGAAVTVSSITSSNAGEFAVSGSTCGSVAAGGGCTFNVTFIPAATGARSASITVASSGTGSPHTILVSGNGNPPGGGGGPTTAVAVEYYHAAFDHYFVTAIQDEITKLDNGTFVGWSRTGKQFKVYTSAGAGLSGVCRFFSTSFDPKSSHFYTADDNECTVVKANKDWTFEAVVFYVPVPALSGACPIGTMPVFRLYNNGQGAAPNHRFTVESTVREVMMAKPIPWIPEGFGIGVTMCSPP